MKFWMIKSIEVQLTYVQFDHITKFQFIEKKIISSNSWEFQYVTFCLNWKINSFFIYLRHFPSNKISDELKALKFNSSTRKSIQNGKKMGRYQLSFFVQVAFFWNALVNANCHLLKKMHMTKTKLVFEIDKSLISNINR